MIKQPLHRNKASLLECRSIKARESMQIGAQPKNGAKDLKEVERIFKYKTSCLFYKLINPD